MSQRHRAAAFARWRRYRARIATIEALECAAERERKRAVELSARASVAKHPADSSTLRKMAAAHLDAYPRLLQYADDERNRK